MIILTKYDTLPIKRCFTILNTKVISLKSFIKSFIKNFIKSLEGNYFSTLHVVHYQTFYYYKSNTVVTAIYYFRLLLNYNFQGTNKYHHSRFAELSLK